MQNKERPDGTACAGQASSKGFKTMCGGQALIEGIMMRGPKSRPWWSASRTGSWRFRRRS